MKIIHRIFYSEGRMLEAVYKLIDRFQWFQVNPLPGNEWEVSVKEENEQLLNVL